MPTQQPSLIFRITTLSILLAGLLAVSAMRQPDTPTSPPPQPSPVPLVWHTYESRELGITLSYLEGSRILDGAARTVGGAIVEAPRTLFVEVPVICAFSDIGYWLIEVQDSPPDEDFTHFLNRTEIIDKPVEVKPLQNLYK